ncbi:SDR family NAD(P)-dependent oxidoreductase [Acetobacter sp.]|uniref:SDR family NAD(P)-dependent oxidoreductase n=1 Tax=Acetobacter sp. TaxID=440 RepID=UPI0025C269C2|nr:SDR family NAD(P)-dependent oxidoreductase [Acetobacter sp.]MCH4090125.1 SDR family NAD(P)-dependent oxidoreductase [Acetobacter sp.]MCI1298821.1 SDR family NAD(P)-dependent oxidoreductase [Acetobacter sp.]MCI1314840.1 SDR family NAD(P)-dependent oxidoreductase [Acetobacter sp.]
MRKPGATSHSPTKPIRILITGASGGIGRALARDYARPGNTLVLWGRNADRLQEIARFCRERGASVLTREIDLSDGHAAIAAFRADDDTSQFDSVILCAGLSDMKTASEKTERAETVLELGLVNYAVPSALTMAAADRMQARGGGKIALIGSVAAYHDLPFAAGYGGSKAGLARFASSARIALAPLGVEVVLIAPGFVDTDMSRRIIGPRPFLVTPEAASRHIIAALARNRGETLFPWPFRLLRLIDRLTPGMIRRAIMSRIAADQKPRQTHSG